ncbi:MAG: hypothetical protein CL678_00435 [Bdellovibrionaceae bacterium]|nr:hypothetical protein [Pseudobdellovibrionaceae bacterium]|tara:strand:- start:1887 stop:2444 length:558 start_codon:yes stop_codon:yes gene_type:complete
MSRRRLSGKTDLSGPRGDVEYDNPLVQASVLASLTAASVSPLRLFILGVPLTAAASYVDKYFALGVAALHVTALLILNDTSPHAVSAVIAGLLGGMILTPGVTAAVLFVAVVVAAVVATAVQLKWNLWLVVLPTVAAAALLAALYMAATQPSTRRKSKRSDAPAPKSVQTTVKFQVDEKTLSLWV